MKNENEVKEFMEKQRKVAIRAARAIRVKRFEISYIEFLPSRRIDPETGKAFLLHREQRQLPNSTIMGGEGTRQRIKVIIRFKGQIKEKYLKKLNEVMKRGYQIQGNSIIYSVKPFC